MAELKLQKPASEKMIKFEAPATDKMLRWQYKKIVGELLLIQQHSSSVDCPCELVTEEYEMCLPKHLLTLESLAIETEPMTDDADLKEKLKAIAGAADDLSRAYREAPEDKRPYADIAQFAREARKELEPYLWQYKRGDAPLSFVRREGIQLAQAEPRWCYGVQSVEKQLGRFAKDLGMIQSKAKKLQKELDLPINICRGQVEMMQTADPWGSRCRNPLTGKWTYTGDCPAVPADAYTIEGNELTWAISPIGMRRYDFVYKVVEASELIPSHDAFTFVPNPKFPQELQPRLRERAAPRVQVERIAATLDPGLLLEDYHATDRGAPIVGADRVVESGNGRAMAIIRAVVEHPKSYGEYRDALIIIAPHYGLGPKAIEKMKTPVLIRERISDVVRTDFVAEANATSSIGRSTVEIARTDADNITTEMLYDLRVLENETIEDALRASRNRDFVNRFLGKLPTEEQASLVDAKGMVNQDGIRRIGTAIFVKAFEVADTGLVLAEKWFESTEPDVKGVFNGIARALGPLARSEALVASGQRQTGLSIAQDLTEAIAVYSKIRKLQMSVSDYLAQMPMFERELNDFQEKVMLAFHDRRRSPKRIGNLLSTYANLVIDSPHPEQAVLIEVEKPSKEAFWEEAMRQTEREAEPAPALFSNVCTGGSKCYSRDALDDIMMSHDPELLERLHSPGETISLEEMRKELCTGGRCYNKSGGEMKMSDPILAEVTSQICSTGICLAGAKKKSKLPICTVSQAKALRRCAEDVKAKIKETGYKGNPFAICRASLGCRPGNRKEKVR